jgi:hypothetical protein
MSWKIRADASTLHDEFEADTNFWEEHEHDYEAIQRRAEAILIAEYDRRFGSNAWAASGNEFPKSLPFYTRQGLANKVYELRYGHPLPKIEWGGMIWATGIFAIFAYDLWKHPEKPDFHGFGLVETLLIVGVLTTGSLGAAFEHFYPIRERKLDKLIAWHAKNPVFIVVCSILVAISLISDGAAGLGWLLGATAISYVIWYGILTVAAVTLRMIEYFLMAMKFVWDVVVNAIWFMAGIVKRVWKIGT